MPTSPQQRRAAIIQFIKYAIVGGIATAVNAITFFAFAYRLIPCLTPDDKVVSILSRFTEVSLPEISDADRSMNALACNAIALVVSNVFCYILNRLFVFKPGRHGVFVEALLFFLVSFTSFVVGSAGQTALIALAGLPTSIAFGAFLVASLAINFVMRKFVVFKG